jgi:hypothetical protein
LKTVETIFLQAIEPTSSGRGGTYGAIYEPASRTGTQ